MIKLNDNYFTQIYLQECEHKEKEARKRCIKQKVLIPGSSKSNKTHESNAESIE